MRYKMGSCCGSGSVSFFVSGKGLDDFHVGAVDGDDLASVHEADFYFAVHENLDDGTALVVAGFGVGDDAVADDGLVGWFGFDHNVEVLGGLFDGAEDGGEDAGIKGHGITAEAGDLAAVLYYSGVADGAIR